MSINIIKKVNCCNKGGICNKDVVFRRTCNSDAVVRMTVDIRMHNAISLILL